MGEGTTRVVEASDAGARVSALGDEISGVRERLDDLVSELDRRRHALADWTRPAARQAGGVALVCVVVAAAWIVAPRLSARYWLRRSRRGCSTRPRAAPGATAAAAARAARGAAAAAAAVAVYAVGRSCRW